MIARLSFATAIFLSAGCLQAAQRYPVTGLILKTDPAHRTFVASCTAIPGYMEAMVMPYAVRDAKQLQGTEPSMLVEFTLVVDDQDSYAENIRIHHYVSMKQEPIEVRSLQLLRGALTPGTESSLLALGERVADFTLT